MPLPERDLDIETSQDMRDTFLDSRRDDDEMVELDHGGGDYMALGPRRADIRQSMLSSTHSFPLSQVGSNRAQQECP